MMPTQINSMIKVRRADELRRASRVRRSNNEIRKPAMLITERERVTMPPAISFAFGRPNDLSTPNAAGATTAPKKRAAPNQQANKMSREKFISQFWIGLQDFQDVSQSRQLSSISESLAA